MRTLCWLVVVLAVAAFGQQDAPTFRVEATLIELTVVALDGKGNPVTDLREDEIEVTDQGRRRDMAFLRFEGASQMRELEPLPPGVFTNRAEHTTGPPRNITAIVIDTLNTRLQDQIFVRSQVLRYLREIAPDTRIGVYRLGRGSVRVLHDFTDDVESLRAALLEHAVGLPRQLAINDERQAELESAMLERVLSIEERGMVAEELYLAGSSINGTIQTLASLEWIGNHVAGIPGRKSIVWISGGIPSIFWGRIHEDGIRRTARRLASQGITMYPVDARGLSTGLDMGRPLGNLVNSDFQGPLWATMDVMSSITGGRSTRNSNLLTKGIELAAADMRGSYTVGFYADDRPDDKWHRLDVKILRRGVTPTHRKGYLLSVPSEQPQTWSEQEWWLLIANPLGSTQIRLDARCEPADGDRAYNLFLQVAADDLHFQQVAERLRASIDVVVADKTATGEISYRVDSATVEITGDQQEPGVDPLVRHALQFQLRPDTVTTRVVVRDRYTGRYGTLDLPVNRLPGQTH